MKTWIGGAVLAAGLALVGPVAPASVAATNSKAGIHASRASKATTSARGVAPGMSGTMRTARTTGLIITTGLMTIGRIRIKRRCRFPRLWIWAVVVTAL
jgi:hypothetical protein